MRDTPFPRVRLIGVISDAHHSDVEQSHFALLPASPVGQRHQICSAPTTWFIKQPQPESTRKSDPFYGDFKIVMKIEIVNFYLDTVCSIVGVVYVSSHNQIYPRVTSTCVLFPRM